MPKRDFTIQTVSEDETIEAGRRLASGLKGVVLLKGELGAGKTTLVRGIVAGIPGAHAGEVSSPTFTLVHEYGAGVFHLDLYRLEGPRDLDSLEIDEIFDTARLALVEWGEKLGSHRPEKASEIHIDHAGEDRRTIHVLLEEE